ncbi:hypothetical protein GCM10010348_76570 [Streptomyces anthocyanicus]|uniref:hypothetical protein n=1 Tax=Streptomyces anthocyanicus TaxID=68174 RepID=UPI0018738597|nr:hypothetical protein [Streptomyces anthocyanicus]GHC37963.1 hypothetical protein GCM10010348_76570 [Streptomyces anthocyanicus]
MTVHSEGQPAPAADSALAHTAGASSPTQQARSTTVRVLAVLLAVMTGIAAALVAFIAGTHLVEGAAQPIVWGATTFIATTGLVILLEEKTGLIG